MPRQTIPDKISIVRRYEARSLLIDRVVASDDGIMAQGHVTGLNGEAICLLESVSAKRKCQKTYYLLRLETWSMKQLQRSISVKWRHLFRGHDFGNLHERLNDEEKVKWNLVDVLELI
jgi:hypothetical protein